MRSVELGLAEILSSNGDYSVVQVNDAWSKSLCLVEVGKMFVDNKRSVYKGAQCQVTRFDQVKFSSDKELSFKS